MMAKTSGVRVYVDGIVARDVFVLESPTGNPWASVRVRVLVPGFSGDGECPMIVIARVFGAMAESLRHVRAGVSIKLRGYVSDAHSWVDEDGTDMRRSIDMLVSSIGDVGSLPTADATEPAAKTPLNKIDGSKKAPSPRERPEGRA